MLASGVISKVLPSGGAALTARLAMMAAAPALFSTITGWPSETAIFSATRRVRVSLLAPGGRPSTRRSGLSWAAAPRAAATPAASPASAFRRAIFIVIVGSLRRSPASCNEGRGAPRNCHPALV